MTRLKLFIGFVVIAVAAAIVSSWGGPAKAADPTVTIEEVDQTYFLVTVDYTNATHQQMGRAYAEQIKQVVPDYEAITDSFLNDAFEALAAEGVGPTLPEAIARATSIKTNIPPEYVDELNGIAEVFNTTADVLNDGKLSQNEMLVYQLFADVVRPTQCSASAAFGTASATGKTILGRNLDWDGLPHNDASKVHTVVRLKNGPKSIYMINLLGQLIPVSGFNDDKLFGAVLDAETGAPYPADLTNTHSYMFDLRYALENQTSLNGMVDFLKTPAYAFNHLAFLADENSAGVLEQNIGSPGRGFRTSDSPLRLGVTWGITDTVATVNDFRLPGNFEYPGPDPADNLRWDNFRSLYTAHLARNKIDIETMKLISGYADTDGSARTTGAIFRSDAIPTHQSVIIRLDTLELWVAFTPRGNAPMPLQAKYFRIETPW